jgi:hypothetical protein
LIKEGRKMARRPIVPTEVEHYISQVYSLYGKKWKAIQVQREVVYNLNHDPKLRKRLNLPAQLPKNWPGLNKVQRVLADIRKYDKEHPLDTEDKPWSLASIENHPIDTQAIPAVMQLFYYRLQKGYRKLTIREAKWADRLTEIYTEWSDLVSDFPTDEERDRVVEYPNDEVSDFDRKMAWLSYNAFAYAFFEQNYEKINEGSSEFNSEAIDELLVPPDPNPMPNDVLKTMTTLNTAYDKFIRGVKNERLNKAKE